MRIAVEHQTVLEYDSDVVESVMDARLGPRSDEHQRWTSYELRVTPTAAIRRYIDGFGNTAHLITVSKPHRALGVVMRAEVDTLLGDPFEPPRSKPPALGPSDRADFLSWSSLVPRAEEVDALAAPFKDDARPPFEVAAALMHAVHERFEYRQDVTTVVTTVPESLAHNTGVCQDFAHVLIALLRAVGIPARYVSGYILGGGAPVRGVDASHAWVEAFTPLHGWRGFDPTNDLLASEHHIKLAIGRDYRDVPPTRGAFRGVAGERLTVAVRTTPVEPAG